MNKPKALFRDETPRGDCFEVALKYAIEARCAMHEPFTKVVHGSVYSTYFRKRIDHAWIELGGVVVVDSTIKYTGSRDHYYSFAQVRADASYSVLEAMKRAGATGTYGPWPKEKKDEKSDKETGS